MLDLYSRRQIPLVEHHLWSILIKSLLQLTFSAVPLKSDRNIFRHPIASEDQMAAFFTGTN